MAPQQIALQETISDESTDFPESPQLPVRKEIIAKIISQPQNILVNNLEFKELQSAGRVKLSILPHEAREFFPGEQVRLWTDTEEITAYVVRVLSRLPGNDPHTNKLRIEVTKDPSRFELNGSCGGLLT